MPTRNVVLTDRQVELIERMVKSGRFQNGSEVLREGLRLLQRQDTAEKAKLRALREAARVGLADIEAGRFKAFDTAEALAEHLSAEAAAALAE